MNEEHDHPDCFVGQKMADGMTEKQAMNEMRKWQAETLQKLGWYIHFVGGDPNYPLGANYHTHGIAESFGHPDLQVVFPLPQKTLYHIFHTIVDRIKEGERFCSGVNYDRIIGGGFSIRMVESTEDRRPVLRIILPDPQGALTEELITGDFLRQYADLK